MTTYLKRALEASSRVSYPSLAAVLTVSPWLRVQLVQAAIRWQQTVPARNMDVVQMA